MILNLIRYIEAEIEKSAGTRNPAQLTALHFDMSSTNTDRAVLFVFEEGSAFPKYVVKYAKNKQYDNVLSDEFENYSSIYRNLSLTLKQTVPKPLCKYTSGPRFATIEEGVPGRTIGSLVRDSNSSEKIEGYLEQAFEFLIVFQRETRKGCKFDDSLRHNLIDRPIALFLDTFHLASSKKETLEGIKENVIDFLVDKSILVSCHGDYWLNNILTHKKNMYVIDWTFCRNEYLFFWDFLTLIYNTKFKQKRMANACQELARHYLKRIDIHSDIERELRLFYFAMRSIWNKHWYAIDEAWDYHWKLRFDKELTNYKS